MIKNRIYHPSDTELADYLSGSLTAREREAIACHLASCSECLAKIVAAYDSVKGSGIDRRSYNGKGGFMKRLNIYLILAVISFLLSFMTPEYFLQFLVATLVLGAKWVVDSKTTKMLIMIQEAFKTGGEKEVSRVLERLGNRT